MYIYVYIYIIGIGGRPDVRYIYAYMYTSPPAGLILSKALRSPPWSPYVLCLVSNRFILVLNLENDRKPIQNNIDNDNETENNKVIMNVLSSFDSKLYTKIKYINDNPSINSFIKLDDINHNFICNNPINIEHNKHPDDPKLNEYINVLKESMKDYIDKNC